jgi:quinol monooxygenase YgiN
MPSPVVVTAVFTPYPGKFEELHQALLESIPAVHEEEGCELYAIHEAPEQIIFMIEKWTTRELLDAHSKGAPVQALNKRIDGLIAKPVEVTLMDPLPAGTPEQGLL